MKKVILFLAAAVMGVVGCQTADPASRSNRVAYRDIYVTVNGASNYVHQAVGDGLYASADGGGDTQSNTPTQTTDTKPEVAVGVGGGSAGTGGAKPTSGLTEEVLSALTKFTGILGGNGGKLTAAEANAIKECVDWNCEL